MLKEICQVVKVEKFGQFGRVFYFIIIFLNLSKLQPFMFIFSLLLLKDCFKVSFNLRNTWCTSEKITAIVSCLKVMKDVVNSSDVSIS